MAEHEFDENRRLKAMVATEDPAHTSRLIDEVIEELEEERGIPFTAEGVAGLRRAFMRAASSGPVVSKEEAEAEMERIVYEAKLALTEEILEEEVAAGRAEKELGPDGETLYRMIPSQAKPGPDRK